MQRCKEEVIREYLKDSKGWEEKVDYGQRWMIETFFSSFKRLFSKAILAKKFDRIVKRD